MCHKRDRVAIDELKLGSDILQCRMGTAREAAPWRRSGDHAFNGIGNDALHWATGTKPARMTALGRPTETVRRFQVAGQTT
jgi:hypothetical protein